MALDKYVSWRELLGHLIRDPHERQRIANVLDVSTVTLTRWANNTSQPRQTNLYNLLDAIPQQRALLTELIAKEFPGFNGTPAEKLDDATPEIPTAFYARMLNAYSTTPQAQRFWSISNLILQQALGQLDPNHIGLAITIVQCMPPSLDNKIRSLRESVVRGTTPWDMHLEQRAIFLGEESLAGYVVTHCHQRVLQNRAEGQGIFSAHWVEWEEGAAAYPILRSGNIAGCLLVSCTQPNFFLPSRCLLIERYAELMTLVFEPEEFYDIQQINLAFMPHYRTQEQYLQGFQQRVSQVMLQAMRERQALSYIEAQQLVWKQLEEELLQLPPYIQE